MKKTLPSKRLFPFGNLLQKSVIRYLDSFFKVLLRQDFFISLRSVSLFASIWSRFIFSFPRSRSRLMMARLTVLVRISFTTLLQMLRSGYLSKVFRIISVHASGPSCPGFDSWRSRNFFLRKNCRCCRGSLTALLLRSVSGQQRLDNVNRTHLVAGRHYKKVFRIILLLLNISANQQAYYLHKHFSSAVAKVATCSILSAWTFFRYFWET